MELRAIKHSQVNFKDNWIACWLISARESDNTINTIFKCFSQTLRLQMKFRRIMILQITQEQSLDYNPF